ncbi:hypothetical protein SAMN05216188_109186 [Lentzea xinjiangensis]|uniref:Secreted protein n=1 Tax=Lentzea xinjiangensis TaxID=402600 RepID=A0A1H9MQ71_9PSEU|nr:hypothetical protein SAMN05216188_109186 [Lentzea xinjiangensis]
MTSALWCARKIPSACLFSHVTAVSPPSLVSAGAMVSTRPIWANASASVAWFGGFRLDTAAPGMPTADTG